MRNLLEVINSQNYKEDSVLIKSEIILRAKLFYFHKYTLFPHRT